MWTSDIKICCRCGSKKSIDNFPKDISKPDGHSYHCKDCQKIHATKNYSKHRKRRLQDVMVDNLRKYGLTLESYSAMLLSQNCQCKICGKSTKELGKRLGVDHRHDNGKVRGLLCVTCNLAIGYLKDSPELAKKTFEYIVKDGDICPG